MALALASGCARSENHIEGPLAGDGFFVREGLSYLDNRPQDNAIRAEILLTDAVDFCADSAAGLQPTAARTLRLELWANEGGRRLPLTPGHYVAVVGGGVGETGRFLGGTFQDLGLHCVRGQVSDVVRGSSVELTGIDRGYRGTFDLTFASGDHVTGAFATSDCATLPDSRRPDLDCLE